MFLAVGVEPLAPPRLSESEGSVLGEQVRPQVAVAELQLVGFEIDLDPFTIVDSNRRHEKENFHYPQDADHNFIVTSESK